MILPAASSPTTDPLDALLPSSSSTSPLKDVTNALHGRLGVGLAVLVVVIAAVCIHRVVQRRKRERWARSVFVSRSASHGFGLYQLSATAPGADVRALTPSWPESSGLADQPTPFAAPDAAELRTAPWATWVRTER